jgi:hypothetical protein
MKSQRRDAMCIILSLGVALHLSLRVARGQVCAGTLTNRADVMLATPGNDYNVYFNNSPMSPDLFPAANAGWVRDALFRSHHVFVNTNGFRNPSFSASPNDTCISMAVGCFADAPNDRIRLQSGCMAGLAEPFTRSVVTHELFHHVQYAYINFGDWPSWGTWTIESTPVAMEDRSFSDTDNNAANCRYLGDVNSFLGNPNVTLLNRSYDAALFWNYLAEQLGTVTSEPNRGVDVIRDFWERARGNSPDSVRYVRDVIQARAPGRTLEDMFIDLAIANFAHNLDLSRLTAAQRARYAFVDESAAGGGTAYNSAARTTVTALNATLSSNVVRWGAQNLVANLGDRGCQAVGCWGQARGNQNLGWAVVGVRSGNKVTELARGLGNVFYRSYIDNPVDPFVQLALIVVGLNDAADFDYAFGFGQIGGTILLPTMDRMAFAGKRDEPRRFQVRLRILGPPVLTPEGAAPISMRGLDPTLFRIVLRSSGTGTAYPATIVNSAYVSGEYWLVVAAPQITNPADGDLYDLEVCVCVAGFDCAYQLANPRAVLYGDVQFNQMLVLDRSYSMHYPEPTEFSKIEAARNAARMYADAAADNDRVGLVTFTGNNAECDLDAALNRPLLRMNDSGTDNRSPLVAAINGVVEDGWTSIGDGLKVGRDALLGASPPLGVRDVNGIVLLSDGLENEGDFWARPNTACPAPYPPAVRDSFDPISGSARNIKIDTIALGPNTDQELLQQIATFTRGTYYAVNSDPPAGGAAGRAALAPASPATAPPTMSSLQVPNRLAHVYRSAQEELHDHDRLHFRAHSLSAGANSLVVPVTEHSDGGVQEASFTFNWHLPSVTVKLKLFDPLGSEITGATPGWTVFRDDSHSVYQFSGTLPPGDYAVSAEASGHVQLLAMLSGKLIRGVDFDAYLSQPPGLPPNIECDFPRPYDYLRGLPVEISANVNDYKGGIAGLQMAALVENPDGSMNRLSLYDDGLHDNGLEGDGIYGNRYTRTPFFSRGGAPDFPGLPAGQWGNYTVHVFAQGKAHTGDDFERFGTRFFQVYEYEENPQFRVCDPDLDDDGIPDRWEDLYGLNKSDPADAGLDYDVDGLSNKDEFYRGTLPFNPDTDGGGESDGSEVAAGRDPLYDKDDLLPAIVDYGVVTHVFHVPIHEPEPNTLILHYPVNTAYRFMEIWRFDWGALVWTLLDRVDLGVDPSGIYYDRGLANEVPYFYALVAEGHSGARTAATAWFVGVPKADPIPPDGTLVINDGAPFTASLNVTVQLSASADATEVMLSQDPAFAGAAYQPFAPNLPFTLSPGPGPSVATIYGKFRDPSLNESIVAHDSILLDVAGDSDGDSLYDAWERRFFGHLLYGPDDDPDGDGVSNRNEFRNGTDPTDPHSPQHAGVMSIRREGAEVIIEYEGTLRSAERVEGPYLPEVGAMSPYRFAPTGRSRFFMAE